MPGYWHPLYWPLGYWHAFYWPDTPFGSPYCNCEVQVLAGVTDLQILC